MRRAAFILVFVAAVSACGDSGLLDGVGDVSRDWVQGATSTTTTLRVESVAGGLSQIVLARDIAWFNDAIEDQAGGAPQTVVAAVWDRRRPGERFIQASRAEIAAAIPGIEFPRFVPDGVDWVTSQLVYDKDSGGLDIDTVAAFGLWSVEPYTITEGRLAVLRIGEAPPELAPMRSDIAPVLVPDGISLLWTEGGLRYELFCRSTMAEDVCWEVAESTVPLAGLLVASGT